jgi:YD repeat-containing protein
MIKKKENKMARITAEQEGRQIMNVDYDGGANPVYVGYAAPGTADSAAGWMICKYTYDSSGNVTAARFAGGAADYDQVWDDRASLSYA